MKIIHTADIHLGSKINSFPKDVSTVRKEELRNSFRRMVDFAKQNGVQVVLISGDLFDGVKPLVKDKDFFYSVVQNNPDIDFLYLKGNHDLASESIEYPNLKTFSTGWASYRYGNVVISGVETVSENATSLYSTLNLKESDINIVMLHGEASDSFGVQKVNLSKLRGKNIDYLALGHYHSHLKNQLDDRGVYAYSGCLEGRGYDETGEKGFVLLDIDNKISSEFIPFSQSNISLVKVDVSNLKDAYSIYLNVKAVANFDKKGIYRVELHGELDASIDDLESDVKKYLSASALYIDVKDLTKKKIDVSKYENDMSLKGEFVRLVYASDLTDDEKAKVLSYGLKSLSGVEVDI